MRFDRTITLSVVRPLRRLLSGVTTRTADTHNAHASRGLPILMYHSVSATAEPGVAPYYRLCTTPERFREQMQWLHAAGWQGVTLSEGIAMMEGRRRCAHRPIAITFDDGFRDFLTEAFPSLAAHGFSATVYLPTDFIGESPRTFKQRECLSWAEVAMLQRLGIEFGSHTVTHPVLYDLAWPEISRELAESKEHIEQRLGTAIASFAYPYAFPQADPVFTARFLEELQSRGFQTSVTTTIGCANPRSPKLRLPRLPANNSDDQQLFLAKLNGDYDWLRIPQGSVKWSKQRIAAFRRSRKSGRITSPTK